MRCFKTLLGGVESTGWIDLLTGISAYRRDIGDEGKILCGGWAGSPTLLPESRMAFILKPERLLPRSIGHYAEWIHACKKGDPKGALAGFEYSGPYTESLLVGNLAVRLGKRIEWNSKKMRASNAPEADALIRKIYRKGWEV